MCKVTTIVRHAGNVFALWMLFTGLYLIVLFSATRTFPPFAFQFVFAILAWLSFLIAITLGKCVQPHVITVILFILLALFAMTYLAVEDVMNIALDPKVHMPIAERRENVEKYLLRVAIIINSIGTALSIIGFIATAVTGMFALVTLYEMLKRDELLALRVAADDARQSTLRSRLNPQDIA